MRHQHSAARARLIAALLLAFLSVRATAQPEATIEAVPQEAVPQEGVPQEGVLQEGVPQPGENVLENGDFEELDELRDPSGWNSDRASSFDLIEDADDNRYAQLKARGDDNARRIFRRFAIDSKWKTLRVSARLKAAGLQIGPKPWRDAHIVLSFYDQDNKILKFTRPIALVTGTAWKLFAGHETIPPNSSHCEIEIANYAQAGDFGVDDVEIEPDGKMQAPLLRPNFPEGRFETLEPGQLSQQPAGWPVEGLAGIALEREGQNHFLRFTNSAPKGHVRVETIWRLQPGARSLRVSARMRARDLQCGEQPWQTARVGLAFTDALGVDAPRWPPALQLRANSDWRTVTQTFPIPTSARFLKIMPELMQARGVLDVDDIQVQQLF